MPPREWLGLAAVILLVATVSTSPAGKVLHSKSSGGQEDKHSSSSHQISRRSVDLTDAKDHLADSRLPRDVIPTMYQLELQPFPEEGHFKGTVRINITCNEPTNVLTLHAHEDLHIVHDEVTLRQFGGRPASQPKDPIAKAEYPFNHKGSPASATFPLVISSTKKDPKKQWYVITLAETLKTGLDYQLELSFSGALSIDTTQGFFRASYQLHRTKEERWFAATKMSPSNARRVFPCFDEPDLKTPFEISVAITDTDRMKAISNMPVKSTEDKVNETDWTWVHFQKSPPMSTFSVGVAVLDLESITSPMPATEGVPETTVTVYARPTFASQLKNVHEKTVLMLGFLKEYLGVPFPLPKLDLVALPHYSDPEPADHWGLIILKESDFINDDALSWRLANEMAQQWFGHLATPVWWGDARINKALANYLATLASNQDKWNWNLVISYSLYYEFSKLHPFASLGSQEEYIKITKIQWLLRMLNFTLTEDTFKDGLNQFLQERKLKTFTEDDLWGALTAQAREDQTLDPSVTVKQIAESWISKDRFPVVSVTRDYNDNSASVEQHMFLRERPHDISERDSLLWWVPLMYLTPDNLNPSHIEEPVVWMKEERHASLINLPGPDNFIIINPNEIGMFMVNYDQQNWALLAQYLRGPGPQVPAATRAKLLHDAWNLAYGGELDIATALNMTLFLEQESDIIVWDVVFTMIDHLGRRVSGTDAGLKFEDYSRNLLLKLTEALGAIQPDECSKKTKLRIIARDFLCRLGDKPCVAEARETYDKWMNSDNPDEGNPVPDSALCTVFKWGTTEEWEFALQRVILFPPNRKQSERSYLLKTMAGCPRQEEKVERLLNITILEGNGNFSETDMRLILNMLTGSATGYTTLFNFLSQNFDEIKQRMTGKTHLWEYLVHRATESFNTQEGLNMVSELYVTRQGEFGAAEPIVEQAIRTITAEAQWSDQNLPAMESWFDAHLFPTCNTDVPDISSTVSP